MRKRVIIIGIIFVLTLVLAGCAKVTEDETVSEMSSVEPEMMDDEQSDTIASDDIEKDNIMMNEGEMAPDFSLKDVNGNTVNLADFKGEKVYVKYWASWCSICLAGIEDVDTLSNNEDFKVITIVTPGFSGEKSSEDFIKWLPGLETENLVVLLDEEGVYAKEFGVRAFPTSAYIGSDGVLVQVLPGQVSNEMINEKMSVIK